MKFRSALIALALLGAPAAYAEAPAGQHRFGPHYKPSGKSKQAQDISKNAYGAFSLAPKAPRIGDTIADFTLPDTTGTFRFEDARKKGEVIVIFYRGDW